MALVSWAFARVGVHRLSLSSPSISRCFSIHSSSSAIGFHSCFSFTTDIHDCVCTHRSTLHLLFRLVSRLNWDWLWYLMLLSQGRSRSAHEAEISFQISALAGV